MAPLRRRSIAGRNRANASRRFPDPRTAMNTSSTRTLHPRSRIFDGGSAIRAHFAVTRIPIEPKEAAVSRSTHSNCRVPRSRRSTAALGPGHLRALIRLSESRGQLQRPGVLRLLFFHNKKRGLSNLHRRGWKMDVVPRVAGLKDRPDPSPERRRDEGLDGRQPARTDVVTSLRVRGVELPIKTLFGRALPIGCRRAATDREGPTKRAKSAQLMPYSQPKARIGVVFQTRVRRWSTTVPRRR